ncbi:F-box/kelch-repeat protein At3g06240-like [Papaver somniferum]|uniref:F-box/kelch-repeat protein At3g06240-like n=1 Tax=Papaver somniferum TaxID=3469 RepID=UPI000E6FB333|nr:F-box/kelch-repeat protein At3g06240-like [Papaver somniferum]
MANLPDDIRRNILSRVPVKNLMRFKTVCKPWYSLIRSPLLGKLHCANASKTGTSSSFIMFRCCFKNKGNVIYSIDYRSLSSKLLSSATCNPLGDSSEMDFPPRSANCRQLWGSYRKEFEIILGSSKGLMCLRSKKPGYEDAICLWNPCTREYKTVPESPHNFRSSSTGVDIGLYGLGYDEENGDFKVVRVAQVDSRAECFDYSVDESETEVLEFGRSYSVYQIYTLGSNSWKKCQTMAYKFHGELKSGVMVNGALHWWAIKRRDGYEAIISFDFTDEIFREVAIIEGSMKHPPGSFKAYENNNVGVLGGCLCVLHKTLDKVDVWVMHEYGINESWMKHFTVTEESVLETTSLRIVCDFANSAVLFKTDDSMIYYDPNHETQRTRKLTVPGTDNLYGAGICEISLMPLYSGTYCEKIKTYLRIG